MLDDENFLQSIVYAVELTSSAVPDQMIGIKDISSINVYCSKYFADVIGMPVSEIIGKVYLMPHFDQFLDIALDEDSKVIKSRESHIFLKINKFHNVLKPLIFIKSPIINPSTQNVVGILFQAFEYGVANNFHQQISNLYNEFLINTKKLCAIKLSKREKQVVFFFLAHLGSQEIADMLYQLENKRITKSTVDSVFTDQLYLKFNVTNRVALYKKLLELDYDKFIPQEILISSSTPLEKVKIY